jgi:hypothetical protein
MHFVAVLGAALWLWFCCWSAWHLWKEQSLFGVGFMLLVGVAPLYAVAT